MGEQGRCEVSDLTWWVIHLHCLPMAIPSDLAGKWIDSGQCNVFLGTYVQAYDLCQGRKKRVAQSLAGPPRRTMSGPPKRVRPEMAGANG